jgi:ribosomal protein S18 acetylase RimI-like enzyme
MASGVRVGTLHAGHRDRLTSILRASGLFRDHEIAVALELFDEGVAGGAPDGVGSDDYRFAGAFDARDELLGYACWGPTPATDRTWDLYWIAVDPAAQGRGVGTRLLTEVERRLSEADARLLVVETSSRDDYAATRAFYRARAYDEVARLREYYAPGEDARVVFTKRVPSSGFDGGVLVS